MVSGIITLIMLLLFVAGWFWAWSPRRKADFDAAAKLAVEDEIPRDELMPEERTQAERVHDEPLEKQR